MTIVLMTDTDEEIASFHISDKEAEMIHDAAANEGIEPAEWVRIAILKAAYRT